MFVYHIPIKRPILQFSISSTLLFTRTSLTVCDAYPRLYKSLWCLLIALAGNVMRSIVYILTAVRLTLFYTEFTAYFPPPFEALVSTITAKRQLVAYTYKCRIPKTNDEYSHWRVVTSCSLRSFRRWRLWKEPVVVCPRWLWKEPSWQLKCQASNVTASVQSDHLLH